MRYKKKNRFLSEERLAELMRRVTHLNEVANSSYEQVGGYKILPGLFDDLLHDDRILNMVRRETGIPDLLPSICSGDYFPPGSDMPMGIDDSTHYQLIIQLNENESWALNHFTEEGEIEEVVLGLGEAVLLNSAEVTSGRMVTPSLQCQAKLCYVDANSPNAFLGISNYQRSSLREYRKYNV